MKKSLLAGTALGLAFVLGIATASAKTVVEAAMEAGKFGKLVQAIQAAELVDALKGEGPITVFAPTDEAFAKLPEGTLEDLLKPENRERLRTVLELHVVPSKLTAESLKGQKSEIASLAGKPLSIDATGDGVKVSGANVIEADLAASNGVIHVIDTVILPQG